MLPISRSTRCPYSLAPRATSPPSPAATSTPPTTAAAAIIITTTPLLSSHPHRNHPQQPLPHLRTTISTPQPSSSPFTTTEPQHHRHHLRLHNHHDHATTIPPRLSPLPSHHRHPYTAQPPPTPLFSYILFIMYSSLVGYDFVNMIRKKGFGFWVGLAAGTAAGTAGMAGDNHPHRSVSGIGCGTAGEGTAGICCGFESVSKQGRKSAKAEPSVHKDPLFDELADDTLDYMDTENAQDVGRTRNVVYEEKESAEDAVSTEDVVSTDKEKVSTDRSKVSTDKQEVSTDKEKVSTDRPDEGTVDQTEGRSATPTTPTTTPTIFGDDETIAQVLLNMSQAKAVSREKEKGVELKDVEETERPRPTSTRSLLTLKPLPKIDPKDKGKKKIEEEDESDTESKGIPEAKKKFKQLARDEEMARKVQEDWEAKEEVKKLDVEEAIKAALLNEYDFIQARIEANRLLALRLQDEERERFTMEERAKFLHDTIAAQRRFLAEQRAVAIRNRPPTRTQLRNQMMTYLKHVGNKKHSDLKNKTFEEIQALYEKVKRFDESFTTVGSTEDERNIKEMNEGAKDPELKRLKKKVAKETPKKEDTTKVPAKVDVTGQSTKKRKGCHMKMLARKRKRPQLDVDSDDEHKKCLKIVTFEGTIDSEIMERKFVIARLNKVSSPDGDYLVIYRANGNFRAFNYLMEDWKIVTWRLYEACRVYILELEDGTVIHMLVERRYPLSKDLLQRMLDLGLEVERESIDALDLIRFIKQQIDEE
ncbi:hypothetical protein Tco_0588007 [Tanacetum coccineum]